MLNHYIICRFLLFKYNQYTLQLCWDHVINNIAITFVGLSNAELYFIFQKSEDNPWPSWIAKTDKGVSIRPVIYQKYHILQSLTCRTDTVYLFIFWRFGSKNLFISSFQMHSSISRFLQFQDRWERSSSNIESSYGSCLPNI